MSASDGVVSLIAIEVDELVELLVAVSASEFSEGHSVS